MVMRFEPAGQVDVPTLRKAERMFTPPKVEDLKGFSVAGLTELAAMATAEHTDRKSTRLNSSHER